MSEATKGNQRELLLIICETLLADRIIDILDDVQVPGFTRFGGVSGLGETGRHEGTSIWPGTNTIVLTAHPADDLTDEIISRIRQTVERDFKKRPGLKIFRLPAEELL